MGRGVSANKDGHVAVIHPGFGTPRKPIGEAVALAGSLGTVAGIPRVMARIVLKPSVRCLLIVGPDVRPFYPAEGLKCLLRNGVDMGRILGFRERVLRKYGHRLPPEGDELNVPQVLVDAFRRQVTTLVHSMEPVPCPPSPAATHPPQVIRTALEVLSLTPMRPSRPTHGYVVVENNLRRALDKVLARTYVQGYPAEGGLVLRDLMIILRIGATACAGGRVRPATIPHEGGFTLGAFRGDARSSGGVLYITLTGGRVRFRELKKVVEWGFANLCREAREAGFLEARLTVFIAELFLDDLDEGRAALERIMREVRARPERFVEDPNGYVVIENGVVAYGPGNMPLFKLGECSSLECRKLLTLLGFSPEHLSYLGEQLGLRSVLAKLGRRFVQDRRPEDY